MTQPAPQFVFVDAGELAASKPAQELFKKMIDAMGVPQNSVLITDCTAFLDHLPGFFKEAVLVTLGRKAAEQVLGSKENLQNLRTQVHALQDGTRVIPTFHPLELLSTPALKKDAWEDLKLAMKHKKVPGTFL
jgi:uracil-DNA glycosylase